MLVDRNAHVSIWLISFVLKSFLKMLHRLLSSIVQVHNWPALLDLYPPFSCEDKTIKQHWIQLQVSNRLRAVFLHMHFTDDCFHNLFQYAAGSLAWLLQKDGAVPTGHCLSHKKISTSMRSLMLFARDKPSPHSASFL